MSDDIVARLRLYANASIDGGWASVFRADLNIAADEIELLRAERGTARHGVSCAIETLMHAVEERETLRAERERLRAETVFLQGELDTSRKRNRELMFRQGEMDAEMRKLRSEGA